MRFELEKVIGNWWLVTIGRSPDDINYVVIADDTEYSGGFYRLEQLIGLYESAKKELPTKDHPANTGYSIIEERGQVKIEIDGDFHATTYEELRNTLAEFLGQVFRGLDQNSTPAQRKEGLEYLNKRDDLLLDAEDTYRELA